MAPRYLTLNGFLPGILKMEFVEKEVTADINMRQRLETKQLLVNLEVHKALHQLRSCNAASSNRVHADLAIDVGSLIVPMDRRKVLIQKQHQTIL